MCDLEWFSKIWSHLHLCVVQKNAQQKDTQTAAQTRVLNNDNLTQGNSHLLLNSTYLLLTPPCSFTAADLLLWT